MWIFIRIIALCLGGLYRLFRSHKLPVPNFPEEAPIASLTTQQDKSGNVVKIDLVVPCSSRIVFKFTQESAADRFFKLIGIASEFQSQDEQFDQAIYIACDHYLFCEHLKQSPKLRSQLLSLFQAGFKNIEGDGRILRIASRTLKSGQLEHAQILKEIADDLKSLGQTTPSLYKDRFARRVIILETIGFGVLTYALSAVWTAIAFKNLDVYVNFGTLVFYGSLFGVALTTLFLLLSIFFLGGSSRSHRIIIELGLLLFLSAPIFGTQALSDINQNFDTSKAVVLSKTVASKEIVSHRVRRGTTYSYEVSFVPSKLRERYILPTKLKVPLSVYNAVNNGDVLEIYISPGRLGLPWYLRFESQVWK